MIFRVFLLLLFIGCIPKSPPKPVVLPLTKNSNPGQNEKTMYSLGYMSEYDIWEFLKDKPSENEVLETFGLPDSVWLDDKESTKFLYYFVIEIQDYNTIEISSKTDSVSGFEWD